MKKNLILGTLLAATVFQAASPAFANKEDLGKVIGGIIGGLAGSKIGKGNGNTAAIIIGAIIGSQVGSDVGQNMDDADRRALQEAQRRCFQAPVGRSEEWNGNNYGSRTGARGSFSSMREGRHFRTQEICREYSSMIYINGRTEQRSGIACSRRDGSYYEVHQTEVSFGGGRGGYDSQPGYAGGVRPPAPMPVPGYSQHGRDFQGRTILDRVPRSQGGVWRRVNLDRPMMVSSIQLVALSSRVQIIDALAYTVRGERVSLRDLTGMAVSNAVLRTDRIPARDRIQAIDVLVVVSGPAADLEMTVSSNEGPVSLSPERSRDRY